MAADQHSSIGKLDRQIMIHQTFDVYQLTVAISVMAERKQEHH